MHDSDDVKGVEVLEHVHDVFKGFWFSNIPLCSTTVDSIICTCRVVMWE